MTSRTTWTPWSKGARRLVPLLLAVALAAGCGAGSSVGDVRDELRRQRAEITRAAGAIAGALGEPDLAFDGAPRRTGGSPGLRLQYLAEATWTGGSGSQERRIAAATAAVEGLGWVVDQGADRLVWATKDDLRVKLAPSALRGSDDVLVALEGPVVEAPEDAFDELVPLRPERLRP